MIVKSGTQLDEHVNILGQPIGGWPTKNIIACVENDTGNSTFAHTLLSSIAELYPHDFVWIDTCVAHPICAPTITLPPPVSPDRFIEKVIKPLLHVSKIIAITDLRGFVITRKNNWQWLSKLKDEVVAQDALCFIFTGITYNQKRKQNEAIARKALLAFASIVLHEEEDGKVKCSTSSIGSTFPAINLKPENT